MLPFEWFVALRYLREGRMQTALILGAVSIGVAVTQNAAFTVTTDTSVSFDAFLEKLDLTDALTKYIVPDGAIGLFRDQLDLAGVYELRLFPDLGGVAARMRRYYS